MTTADKYKALTERRLCDFTHFEIRLLTEIKEIGLDNTPESLMNLVDALYAKMESKDA
jgi:hypothetical protein